MFDMVLSIPAVYVTKTNKKIAANKTNFAQFPFYYL